MTNDITLPERNERFSPDAMAVVQELFGTCWAVVQEMVGDWWRDSSVEARLHPGRLGAVGDHEGKQSMPERTWLA